MLEGSRDAKAFGRMRGSLPDYDTAYPAFVTLSTRAVVSPLLTRLRGVFMSDTTAPGSELRSSRWYGKLDRDGFIHRSWMKSDGYPR